MTEKRSSWLSGVLSAVPRTEPPTADNVVHMPRPTLDELETDCRKAQNAVVAQGIEVDRAVMAYRTNLKALDEARNRLADRLKESGAKVEFTQQFPDIE